MIRGPIRAGWANFIPNIPAETAFNDVRRASRAAWPNNCWQVRLPDLNLSGRDLVSTTHNTRGHESSAICRNYFETKEGIRAQFGSCTARSGILLVE